MRLKQRLIKENKIKWLDLGCGKNFEEGFFYLDVFPKKSIELKYRKKYFKANILNISNKKLSFFGKFDLIRMQHVLEHFSYEDGLLVLEKVSRLLKKNGCILITVPDLIINIKKYVARDYKKCRGFKLWALKRIPKDSPMSFYFSIFAHSLPKAPHKWCYDYEGIFYILKSTRLFKNIRKIELDNPLASIPFTHNRPKEDLCVLAFKK